MLDTKRILQLGIGVAVGMVAYHFISQAMTANGGTVGAGGKFGVQRATGLCNCRKVGETPCSEPCRKCCRDARRAERMY
jgi:hypothetical protein